MTWSPYGVVNKKIVTENQKLAGTFCFPLHIPRYYRKFRFIPRFNVSEISSWTLVTCADHNLFNVEYDIIHLWMPKRRLSVVVTCATGEPRNALIASLERSVGVRVISSNFILIYRIGQSKARTRYFPLVGKQCDKF